MRRLNLPAAGKTCGGAMGSRSMGSGRRKSRCMENRCVESRRVGEWPVYAGLSLLAVLACLLFTWRGGVFGATMDWLSQHSVIPDYFRQQFYETGELFPEFAASLGGGQNIYYFSYYGLYSPVILFSYLLPFVKMSDYLMAASIAGIAASVCLMYRWLGKRGFSFGVRLSVSVIFLLAGPMIYQSCHQVMFVNYMPFLCMAFLGVDRYFDEGRSGLYTCGVFLMIMTSFYFSVCGMLVLVIYGLSRWAGEKERIGNPRSAEGKPGTGSGLRRGIGQIGGFLRDGLRFLMPMLTAVLTAGVLLVPTALVIFSGSRGTRGKGMGLSELLTPDIPVFRLLYSSYGIGLSALALMALVVGFSYRKWRERILIYGCTLVLIVPFFSWLLNGGLYVRNKAVIPFLPLLCYVIALYLEKNRKRELTFFTSCVSGAAVLALLFCGRYSGSRVTDAAAWRYLVLMDGLILMLSVLAYQKFRRLAILVAPAVVCLFLYGLVMNGAYGGLTDRETYAQTTDAAVGDEVKNVLKGDAGLYRIEQSGSEEEKSANLNRIWDTGQWVTSLYSSSYNKSYDSFRRKTFQVEQPFRNSLMQSASDNPLYQRLMGVKYQIGRTEEGLRVSENAYTAPVIYATDRVISETAYRKLEFPYNQTALMNYAVVKEEGQGETGETALSSALSSTASQFFCALPEISRKRLTVKQTGEQTWLVNAKKSATIRLTIPGGASNRERLLYLQVRVRNCKPSKDVAVWLNGTRNKLSSSRHIYYNGNRTFTWVTTVKAGQSEATLTLGEGRYELSELRCYIGDVSAQVQESGVTEGTETGAAESGSSLYQSAFQKDEKNTKGNRICGTVDVKRDGYLITSIPYDTGFTIRIDGKRADVKKVNTAFLGCSIDAGKHTVELIYHAPGLKAGKALSALGLLLWIGFGVGEARRRRKGLPAFKVRRPFRSHWRNFGV